MAQWTTIDPNTLLPGDPWTSAKAQAAFENLEAVAEGAAGAPRIEAASINNLFLGLTAGDVNVWNGLTDLDTRNWLSVSGQIGQIRTSVDNGANWSSATSVTAIQNPFAISLATGQVYSRGNASLLATNAAPINAVQIRTTSGPSRAFFEYMYRGDGL